jgi:hypothetical protein
MRPNEQAQILDQRRLTLGQWRREMDEAVIELGRLLGIDPPAALRDEPARVLPVLRRVMADDMSGRSDRDRTWVATRLLAIVGQVLIRDRGAEWMVEDDATSSAYARYVLRRPGGRSVDLGAMVTEFLAQPAGREVIALAAAADWCLVSPERSA